MSVLTEFAVLVTDTLSFHRELDNAANISPSTLTASADGAIHPARPDCEVPCSLQPGVFRLSLLENRDVWVGVFPR
jgi:hypothetical protein